MTLAEKLLQDFCDLPDDKQQQVINFVELLRNKQQKEIECMMDDIIAENKEAFLKLAKLYDQAKRSAAAESRTVPMQIAYWAKIGKAALDNPDLPIEFIRDVLVAKQLKEREPFDFSDEN